MTFLTAALPDSILEITGSVGESGSYDGAGALVRLWTYLLDTAQRELSAAIQPFFQLTALILFCALSAGFCTDKRMEKSIQLAGTTGAALMMTDRVSGLLSSCVGAMDQLADYSRAALPTVFSAAAVGGAPVTAAARYGAVCLALDVMMSLSKKLLLPLIDSCLALSLTKGLFPTPFVNGLLSLLKKTVTLAMTVLTTAFTAYIGITGLVSGSANAAAVKTTKAVISTALPVVGGVLSDAASAVLSSAAAIRGASGALGLVAVCALCIGPLVLLSLRILLFRAAAAFAEALPGKQLSGLLADLGGVLNLMIGLLGTYAILVFFSFVSAIKAVAV